MSSSLQRGFLSTVWLYVKAAWRCMKIIKQIPLLCSKSNSDVQKTTDGSQKVIVSSTSVDPTSDVKAQSKNLKRIKKIRRKRGKLNTEPTTEEPSQNTTDALDRDKNNRDAEKHTNTAIPSATSPKLLLPCSTSNHEEKSNNKKSKICKKRRCTKGKPANDGILLPPKSLLADSQKMDNDLEDKKQCSSPTKTPAVNCEEPKEDDDFSEWHVVKNVRKPRTSLPYVVPHAKEQQKRQQTNKTEKSLPFQCEAIKNSRNYNNNKPVDALKKSGGDAANTKPSEPLQCNAMGLKNNNGERFKTGARQKFIRTKASSNNEIKINEWKNARIPRVAATREAAANKSGVKSETKRQYDKTEELKRSVKWLLNKLTEENVVELTKNLEALPMDTVEHLQTTADVIFEKVLYERNFVHLYASLCSDIKSLQVTCDGGKSTVFFLSLILKNCQKQFKEDRAHRADGVKKLDEINSCKNHEKKKKLQREYEMNERRSRKRSIGNCRFIGELFKTNLIKTSIMAHCIADLLEQITESSLECLCILLKTAGTDLEKTCKLNETFDKLKSLALKKTISLRMRYIIKSTIDLWKKS